ncbi:serine hydrolase [Oscillibacter sp.]|jgi:CubicO group peptidase (beta-lactamase class C family)|uniref:serine hydrolase n=1 Tax=Oscillibacter sp. TaxID=1945593 RepID=UPI00217239D8|nr:serine hydrolase [Oscillibacter sp.]MCI9647971.1 serine hydrolase [Oscillibacter sp.]
MFRKKTAGLKAVKPVCLLLLAGACIIACAASVKRPGQAAPDRLSGTVPAEDVPKEALPLRLEDIRKVAFADVDGGEAWADCVRYMAYQGILGGAGTETFRPEGLATRAAVTAAMFRMSGEDAPEYAGTYEDVQAEDWFAGALAWALEAGVLEGAFTETSVFAPQRPVTRVELAVMLARHAGYMAGGAERDQPPESPRQLQETALQREPPQRMPAAQMSLEDYRDGGAVPEALVPEVSAALAAGLFRGMISDTVFPNIPVNRWQLAQTLTALAALETGEPLAVELAGKLGVEAVNSVIADNHEAVRAKVEEIAARYGAVGLQVAVLEDGVVTDSFACGWAVKNADPMTADHKMRVASLSKVGVGMAAMVLRDRGVIDLDAGIGDYWGISTGNTRYPDTPVSVRSLLSHTSSIPLYGDDVSRSRGAVEARLRGNQYNSLKPGSVWSWGYNNYGFAVLGMTLELAGKDYLDNILDQSLWSVMEIDAAFEGGEIRGTDKLVTIYRHDGSVGRSAESQRNYKRPAAPGNSGSSFAGGLTISAKDLGKLLGLLVNDGTYQGLRLLSEESVELMETRFDQILSDGTYQALPLRSQDGIYGRDRLYYHTGSAYGVYNFMSYDPAAGDGIVVLSTGASAARDANGIYAVCGDISRYFYELTAEPS